MSKLFEKITQNNVHVIGEIACGHEGDYEKLTQLVECVAESNCQAVKFQVFKTHERAIKGNKEWGIFNGLELSEEDWIRQAKYAKSLGLYIFVDVYGEESLSIADKMGVNGYKIHSEDLLNTNFILDVCKKDKIVIIGIGGARRSEINNLLKLISKNIERPKVILMTGVQVFPTPVNAHSIIEVSDLIDKYSKYGVKIGFSDHVEGNKPESFVLPVMAISAGAVIIEKHLTIDRSKKWIDYHSALSCPDFKYFISQINLFKPLFEKIGPMNSYEESYRKMFKKSPAFSRKLDKGHVIDGNDIIYVKNVDNSIPLECSRLVGRSVNCMVEKGQLASLNLLDSKVGAIIVVRCGSSRLPNKALMEIDGRESIARVIDRIKKCKEVDQIILATTYEDVDEQLISIAKREGIEYFKGSTENVALRYFEAAKKFKLDHFVRVTGDAILCDEKMIDKAITSHLSSSCDVTFMKKMPFGTHKEVVSLETLNTIIEHASDVKNTEYLEYYLENSRNFNINYMYSDYKFDNRLRMTLDYQEDLDFFNIIFKYFNKINPNFTLKDALNWLKENDSIIKINSHKTQKTPVNLGLDVTLNI